MFLDLIKMDDIKVSYHIGYFLFFMNQKDFMTPSILNKVILALKEKRVVP